MVEKGEVVITIQCRDSGTESAFECRGQPSGGPEVEAGNTLGKAKRPVWLEPGKQ